MEDEKRRRRAALEAGREMLENYKANRSSKRLSSSLEQASDEESLINETENQSMDLKSVSNNESVSMSEGEGDGEFETLTGRVKQLQEQLQSKEIEVEVLSAEIDHLRADASSPTSSHSQNSSIAYKDSGSKYLLAINQRDRVIDNLHTSLKQALAARDILDAQVRTLNSHISNYNEKISTLENTLSSQTNLAYQLEQAQQNVKRLEHEKETQYIQLSNYKSQIEYLNQKIKGDSIEIDDSSFETHLKQKQCEDQVEKIKKDMKVILDKFAAETNANNIKHENAMKELTTKYEAELQKLKDENENLQTRHAKETSELQSRLYNYKRTIDSLKLDLVTSRETHEKDKELLAEQIKLHKLQLEDISAKYFTAASILDSKESIERSLEQALSDAASLRSENETLKFKLDDLTSRYSAAQNLIENSQVHERLLSNKVYSLEKSISRLSGFSITELDATTYETLNQMSVPYQVIKQQLEEQEGLKQELVKKIKDLEDLVSKTKTDLESANLVKENYEKQVKDLKNNYDRLKDEFNTRIQQQQHQQRLSVDSLDNTLMPSVEFEQEILKLKKTIEKRDAEIAEYIKNLKELNEVNQKLQEESDKLKNGLASAYAQCAAIEEKLDQTLGFGDSKLEESATLDQTISSNASSLNLEELLHRQSNYNKVLQKLDTCRKQLEDYDHEKMSLLRDIEEQTKKNDEILANAQKKEEQLREEIQMLKMEGAAESKKFQQLLANIEEANEGMKKVKAELEEKHAKEMEELRTYFEQKCLQMEKQYSEEIFSQQSKKMSDNDSEIEELTEDLYVGSGTVDHLGGGGDAIGVPNKEVKNDSSLILNDEHQNILEDKIAKITADYEEKLENLRKQLQDAKEKSGRTILLKAVNQFCQTEQSSSVVAAPAVQESCNELNELRADYNRQLEEQVGLARVDIINALREQIEALLTVESESDENWPIELLELRDKLTNNAKREMQVLKERHIEEIKRLKEGSNQVINDLQETIKRIKAETHESLQSNLIKERDLLHKTCGTLKTLVTQLIDYFADCEEELNNTLISEVLKKQFMPRSDSNLAYDNEANAKVKRVRFAPQSCEISSLISNDLQDLINSEKDIMKVLKGDLDTCLQRLKSECAKILNSSFSDSESWSTGIGDSPSEKLVEAEKLLANFQEENEHLKVKVIDLQQRLLLAENKKEVISEGYGEQDETVVDEEPDQDFSQLQDRAKCVVMNGSNDTGYLLQIIDEMCRHRDKSLDEMRKDKEDLQHQIEAADKQLRSTRKFQEEQAVEREIERDEAARQIQQLQEKLKEREREKDRDYRINSVEVEGLTVQLREAEAKKSEAESELKDAVQKIWELREVIRELEHQLQSRAEREDILGRQIEQLEEIIAAQTRNQQELVQELELVKDGSEGNQLSEHIGHLQEELRKAQLSSEQLTANSSALRQLRLEIRDLQSQLNRKTRELEAMHVCGSSLSLSQPSEDVSIREQIEAQRCPTPDDPASPPVLPLENILKLKDSLAKHFRVEDVALKRLKDLELQLMNLQRQNEELLAEQELLQQTTSEQLFQIETLRARLEQQKQNAPFAQRQATNRLESQVFELNDRLEIAERTLHDKDVELTEVKGQLERVSRILAEKENEIANVVQSENDVMQKLRDKIEVLEEEKQIMHAKLSMQGKSQNNLPQIIDSIIADKNAEIDSLREELARRDRQLEVYMSLDEAQLRDLLNHNDPPKNSARTLSDILSINSECEEGSSAEGIREAPNFTRSQNVSHFKLPNMSIPHSKRDVVDFSQAITETPKVPRLELGSQSHSSEAIYSNIEISKEMDTLQMQTLERVQLLGNCPSPDIDETHESTTTSEDHSDLICPRHGNFGNVHTPNVATGQTPPHGATVTVQRIQELEAHLCEIKEELDSKTAALVQRDAELMEIQNNLEQLHKNIESLNHDRLFYKAEYEQAKDNESKIQNDMLEVENVLKMKVEELEDYKEKLRINEKLFYDEIKRGQRNEATLQEKVQEITNLKEIIVGKDITIGTLQARTTEVENENKKLYEYRRKFEAYQQEMAQSQNEIQRLSEGLNSRDQMIRRLEEIARRSSLSGGSSPSEKDQEIYHLQEYIKEKDKVIRQMSDDSKSLHRALETIQNKMKESGNVVELRRKLREVRKDNLELSEEIAKLRTELEMLSSSRRPNEEDNDITEMVQQQLNLSARLDQQLLNVIDSESEDVLKCNDLKQANREIEDLNRIKDDLEVEREMLKSQIAEYESRIMQLNTDVEDESQRVVKLEEDLAKKERLIRSLQLELQREKNTAEEDKARDTKLISQLRIKLDEALEVRNRLYMERKNLEVMNAMKHQNNDGSAEFQSEQEKQQIELAEKLEIEKRKCEEIQDALKNLEAEKDRLQKQCEVSDAEIRKLVGSLDLASLEKDQLKSDLQRAKEELKAKTKECEWQKSILKTVSDAENKRNQQRSSEHSELKNLRRELKNSQEIMIDFEADMKALKEQLAESAERETQLSRCIESLTDKETEFTEQLTTAKTDEKKLRDIIADQDKELKMYLRREIELVEELKKERSSPDKNNSPSKILQRMKNLNATIDRLSQDKVHLYEKIAQLREENKRYLDQMRDLESQLSQKSKGSSAFTREDSEERLQYFCGKYLRSDSRRKALIYQKNYLLCILAGYQYCEENTLAFLTQLTQEQRKVVRPAPHRRNPRVRFRSAVLLVVSIHRMKWLILRWQTGKRVGANVMLGGGERQSVVSSARHARPLGTSGHSPPVRERTSNEVYLRRFTDITQSLHL